MPGNVGPVSVLQVHARISARQYMPDHYACAMATAEEVDEPPTPQQVREALVALGTDLGGLPDIVTWDDWPELLGRLLGQAFQQLRRGDESDDLEAKNARIVASYQATIDPEGNNRIIALDTTSIALGHFGRVLASLDENDDDSQDEYDDEFDTASRRLLPVVVQLLKVAQMASGAAAAFPLLLAHTDPITFGHTIQERASEARAALQALEQAAGDMVPQE